MFFILFDKVLVLKDFHRKLLLGSFFKKIIFLENE